MDIEERTALAERVKAAYINRRRLLHPYWRSTARWDQFWGRVADTLARIGVDDPDAYIEAQFEMVKPFPRPNCLHSQRAVLNYEDWARQRDRAGRLTEWELQVKSEIGFLASRRNAFGADSDLMQVRDPATPLSPLFRVCWLMRSSSGTAIPPAWFEVARRIVRVGAAVRAYRGAGLLDDEMLRQLTEE